MGPPYERATHRATMPQLFIELRSHAKHGYGDREFDSRTASGSAVTRASGTRDGSLQVKLHREASVVEHERDLYARQRRTRMLSSQDFLRSALKPQRPCHHKRCVRMKKKAQTRYFWRSGAPWRSLRDTADRYDKLHGCARRRHPR